MRSIRLMVMLCLVSLTSACLGPETGQTEALFKDVSKRPPDARPETITALKQDPPFAKWVVRQDALCDLHGCAQ